jgi:hypothetical protein
MNKSNYRWLKRYESKRHKDGDSWVSTKYDFTDPTTRLEYVPEVGCSVGACISALKRSWKGYRIAGRNGEPRDDIAYRIRNLQSALGIEQSFSELGEESAEVLTKSTETEEDTSEWSTLDKQLLKEERESEKESDDWWFL